MRRYRAVTHRRYYLAKHLGSNVANRENAVYVGLCAFVGNDISILILQKLRKYLCCRVSTDAYEKSVHFKFLFLSAYAVFKNNSAKSAVNNVIQNTPIPQKLNVLRRHQRFAIYLGGT